MQPSLSRWSSISILGIVLLGAASLAMRQTEPGAAKDRTAAASEYLAALQGFKEEALGGDGLDVTIKVIPDECAFEVAKRYEDCVRRGIARAEIEKALKATLSEQKGNQGRPIFILKLDVASGRDHFFFPKDIKSHIGVTRDNSKDLSGKISDPKGVTVSKWWIKETASGKDLRQNMGYFRTVNLELRPAGKAERGQKEPFNVKIVGLLRYQEVQKSNPYDRMGINVNAHQITLGDFNELKFPEIEKTFYPNEWKLPELPKELSELLAVIDAK
ncbi:MAG: hypothetical protein L0Z55_12765 [Planctomycetes bacterium]|nr:hypothetical protein [Planctomycetota bacterium]